MDLGAAVDELYGADLADFIAARTRLVTRAEEESPDLVTELKALRKPTVVAWLLNRVARREPTVIADLVDLGERMRTAQAKGDGSALAAARPERREAIEALISAARRCAEESGTTFGTAAADGVGGTAVAALADPASGEALTSGRLLRPLTYAGFGEIELDDAVAVLRLVPPLSSSDGGDDEEDDAATPDGEAPDDGETERLGRERERERVEARDALRESERDLSAARLAHSEAAAALEAAAEEVERLEAEVDSATERVTRAETHPVDD